MATKCDISKTEAENIINNQEEKDEYFDKKSAVNYILDEGKELQEVLDNEFPKGRFQDESVINKKINDLYGPMSKAKKLAIKIRALMNANESLAEYILQFAIEHIGENQKVGTGVAKNKNGDLVQTERHLVLSRFPMTSLKVIYREALKPSFSTEGVGIMNFDGILTPLITPKQRSLKEPSGAFWVIRQAVNSYANRVSHRIVKFTSKSKEHAGMDNVLSMVEGLTSFHKKIDDPELSRKYTRIFSMFMDGRIFQNDNGEWMIMADYGPITNERNFVQFFDGTNDIKHGWQNPVLLKDFAPPNKKKGAFYIDMPDKARQQFFKAVNEARKIDDLVLPYFEKEMQKSLEMIADELHKAFPNLKREEVFQILFRGKTPLSKQLSDKILSKLTPEQLEMYNMLQKTFEPVIQNEFVIVNGSKVEKRKNHWPGQFNEDLFKPMLDQLIMQFDNTIEALNELYDNKEDNDGNKFSSEELSHLRKTIRIYNSKLNYANVISKKLDGYPVDIVHNNIAALVNDNKFFKRITGAYDRRQSRTDGAVYYDYLRNMSGTVERNILISKLIKSIVMSKNKNSAKMHKIVSESAINLFKLPFHGTDVYRKGFLNRIIPTPNTVEGVNKLLNRIPGREKTSMQLNKTYRAISSYLSGTYLSGLGTTIQNMGDALRNIIYTSFDEVKYANGQLGDKAIINKINSVIESSGIIEFSDFFSRSMVNGVVDRQVEATVADGILKAMMDFHNNNRNATKGQKNRNLKKFKETVLMYLQKSESIFKPEDFLKPHLSKEQIKRRRKEVKQNKRIMFTNRLVQFAIEKDYVFIDAIKKRPWSKYSKMAVTAAVEAYKQVTTLGPFKITVSSTERYIRSLSFIIGLNRAQNAGLMRQDMPWYEFTEAKDLNEAIRIGRNYQEKVNFGLSTQAVGEYFYNGWGMLQGKFKYWSNQKFGADVRLFSEAYASMKSIGKIESNAFDLNAVGKLLKTIVTTKGSTLRTAAPEIAALKKFMVSQLPLTIVMDVVTLGLFPGFAAVKWARQILYMTSGSKALRGFTSDLVSLSLAPIMILGLLASGNMEDEEELEQTIKYYMRKTFFGFVPMWAFDNIVGLLQVISGSTKRGLDNLIDASSAIRGGNLPWNTLVINPAAKAITKEIDD